MDRLSTVKIIDETDGKSVIKAEVFCDGIDMRLRIQADIVKVCEKFFCLHIRLR